MSEDNEGLNESYAAVAAQKRKTIQIMREHIDCMKINLELFVLDASEAIKAHERAIEHEANALYHLESMRLNRMPEPSTEPGPPVAPRAPAPVFDEQQSRLAAEFLQGTAAPGFAIEAPADAKQGIVFTTWETVGDPRWSAADTIDEEGNRHCISKGQLLIFDKYGKLVSERPIAKAKIENGAQ